MLQLTKYWGLWESRFHGQTRQFHGRMRHLGSCRQFCGGPGVVARGESIMVLELAGEVAGVLITETGGSFLDGAAIAQEFDGLLHS